MAADQRAWHNCQRCPRCHSHVSCQVHRAAPSRVIDDLASRGIVSWGWGKCRRKRVRRSCAKGPRTERIAIHAEIISAGNTDGLLDGFGEASRLIGAAQPSGAWPVKFKVIIFACWDGQIQIQHAGVGEVDLEPVNINGRGNTRLHGGARREQRRLSRRVIRLVTVGIGRRRAIGHGHDHGSADAKERFYQTAISLCGEGMGSVAGLQGVPRPGKRGGCLRRHQCAVQEEFHFSNRV